MRSPFNWVGNKYRYLNEINDLIRDEKYSTIYDVFMGSGNILVNLDCKADLFVGNDIIPLLPNLYNTMEKDFTIEEVESIIAEWNRFSYKEDYYDFRDYWNVKYLGGQYDRAFICETIILLKMCSNSMVRFNRKEGYFNQGFRGLAKTKDEFFSDIAISNILNSLNKFSCQLASKKISFKNEDFKDILKLVGEDDLVILDPPYILSGGMYGTDFTEEDDRYTLDFLKNTKADFILFNYLSSGDTINEALEGFIEEGEANVKILSERDGTGQGRKGGKSIEEVMVYRMKRA